MAQAGFTPIITYHSTTPSAVPLAGDLAPGELALNIADMKLYAENSSGVVTLLAQAGAGTGTVTSVATGSGLTGGPITTTGTVSVATNGITNTMLRQSAAFSVIGRQGAATGDVADISASANNQVLRRNDAGTLIAFGALNLASTNAVTNTLGVANGGTGQSTFTDGQLLIGNTTGNTLTKATLTAGTGISITNGAGSITVAATNNGTVTSVGGTGTVNGLTLTGTVTSSGNLTLGGTLSGVSLTTAVTGTLPIANGGTGSTATAYCSLTTNVSGILPAANGGTNNAFFQVSGPATSTKTYTFPNENMTVVGTTQTQTLTSKRVTPRIDTVASAATITPTGDSSDQYTVTALATAATIAAPSGTPTDGQKLVIRIKDNGTARALTWTTTSGAYRAVGVTLPTTTVISKVVYIGCIYNSQDTFWDVIAVAQQA